MTPVQKLDISFLSGYGPKLIGRLNEVGRAYEFITDLPWYSDVPDDLEYSAEFTVIKPDNTFVVNTAWAYLVPDNPDDEDTSYTLHVMVRLSEQMVAVKGLAHYNIKVTNNYETPDRIYTQEGELYIDDSLLTDELIESVAEVNGSVFPDDFVTVDNIGEAVLDAIDDNITEISASVAEEIIDDNNTDTGTTWSSDKIADELSQVGGSVDYSATEHEIGTWTDGSTLYEMTIEASNVSYNSAFDVAIPTDINIKEMHGIGRIWLSNRFYYMPIGCVMAGNITWNGIKVSAEPKYSRATINLNAPTGSTQTYVQLTIRYTKP